MVYANLSYKQHQPSIASSALDNIIQRAANAKSQNGTVDLYKYDLTNAFMRVSLLPSMILKLAVTVPTPPPDKDTLIADHMALLMGWMGSPLTFCMVTETMTVLANAKITQGYIPAM